MRIPRSIFLLATTAFLLAVPAQRVHAQAASTLHPENVIGNARCEECHKEELQAWKVSTHARSDSVHRDPKTKDKAAEIAKAMGISSVNEIAAHPLCTECHFTRQKEGGTVKVIGGVSCESCHGGAKEWRDVHGNRDKLPDRAKRQELSKAAGMLYPEDTYAVAQNCFNCHVVRDEDLVVKGGHPARSEGFNLVSWSQGEVRHNFYTPTFERVEDKNLETRPERKRMFLVVGMLLDLEYSLRGLANGKVGGGPYRQAMGKRAHTIINAELPVVLKALGGDGAPAEIKEIAEIAKGINLSAAPAEMTKAADEVGAKAKAFSDAHDGSAMAGIDALVPSASKGKAWAP
ncbi:multiheme c-type cytochrome [soil metagenome]